MAANTAGTKVQVNDLLMHYMLFDAVDATAADDGQWIDVGGYRYNASLEFVGIAGGTVFTLAGSNAKTQPANTANGTAIGGTVSADGWMALSNPPRWLKARVTSTGTGTPSVGYLASRIP